MLFKKSLILLLLPLFAFVSIHKYYFSATEVFYSDNDQSFQITSRYFIDDFEAMMKEKYTINPQLSSKKEIKNSNDYFDQYLQDHFIVKVNGKKIKFVFLGKEYENDVVKCYMESEKVVLKKIKSVEIENSSLFEMFDDQQNIVHLRMGSVKKSYSLNKDDETIMLSF